MQKISKEKKGLQESERGIFVFINTDTKVDKKGGRKTKKMSLQDFKNLINEEIEKYSDGDFFDYSEFFYGHSQILKDLSKIEFDLENFESETHEWLEIENQESLMGFQHIEGFSFWGCYGGGDWEEPVFFIIYHDGSKLRGYVPVCGNVFNLKTKQALGNDEEADVAFLNNDIVTDVHNGRSYNASDLTVAADGDDYIAYVTRTDENNGVSMCVQVLDYDGLEKANAITIGDTTATIFFQEHDFITGPHIIVIRAEWFNVYTANFIISLLNKEKYRYPVFGRAFSKDLIKETMLYLPINNNGSPDFEFMEDYIKSLPFSCNLANVV